MEQSSRQRAVSPVVKNKRKTTAVDLLEFNHRGHRVAQRGDL